MIRLVTQFDSPDAHPQVAIAGGGCGCCCCCCCCIASSATMATFTAMYLGRVARQSRARVAEGQSSGATPPLARSVVGWQTLAVFSPLLALVAAVAAGRLGSFAIALGSRSLPAVAGAAGIAVLLGFAVFTAVWLGLLGFSARRAGATNPLVVATGIAGVWFALLCAEVVGGGILVLAFHELYLVVAIGLAIVGVLLSLGINRR